MWLEEGDEEKESDNAQASEETEGTSDDPLGAVGRSSRRSSRNGWWTTWRRSNCVGSTCVSEPRFVQVAKSAQPKLRAEDWQKARWKTGVADVAADGSRGIPRACWGQVKNKGPASGNSDALCY